MTHRVLVSPGRERGHGVVGRLRAHHAGPRGGHAGRRGAEERRGRDQGRQGRRALGRGALGRGALLAVRLARALGERARRVRVAALRRVVPGARAFWLRRLRQLAAVLALPRPLVLDVHLVVERELEGPRRVGLALGFEELVVHAPRVGRGGGRLLLAFRHDVVVLVEVVLADAGEEHVVLHGHAQLPRGLHLTLGGLAGHVRDGQVRVVLQYLFELLAFSVGGGTFP